MKKYIVSIPEPCTASVQNMTPVPGGRFCTSCQKQVVDFTNMTDQQLIDYLKKHNNVCGSLISSQLNRELVERPKHRWAPAAFLAGVLALVLPATGNAQVKISGKVIESSKDKTPIPYATVVLLDQNGKPTTIGTVTKADGTFMLDVPAGYEKGVKVRVSSIGYETKMIKINEKRLKEKEPINCTLKMDVAVFGGLGFQEITTWQRLKNRWFS